MTAWQAPALRGKGPGPRMWPGSDQGAVDCPAAAPTRPVARARTAATPGLEPMSLPLDAAIVTSTGGTLARARAARWSHSDPAPIVSIQRPSRLCHVDGHCKTGSGTLLAPSQDAAMESPAAGIAVPGCGR